MFGTSDGLEGSFGFRGIVRGFGAIFGMILCCGLCSGLGSLCRFSIMGGFGRIFRFEMPHINFI